MGENGKLIHIHRNGHEKKETQTIHMCKIEWLRKIDTTIMPFSNGSHANSAQVMRIDGYVCAQRLHVQGEIHDAGILPN